MEVTVTVDVTRLLWDMARAIHQERGNKPWDKLTNGAQVRWYKEAERIAWHTPALRKIVWNQ